MTITPAHRAISWFYQDPGKVAYDVVERVRLTLWDARVMNFWYSADSKKAPFKVSGEFNGAPSDISWQPSKWMVVRVQAEASNLVKALSYVIGVKPTVQYTDVDNYTTYEWRLTDADDRWFAISGNPAYSNAIRLN